MKRFLICILICALFAIGLFGCDNTVSSSEESYAVTEIVTKTNLASSTDIEPVSEPGTDEEETKSETSAVTETNTASMITAEPASDKTIEPETDFEKKADSETTVAQHEDRNEDPVTTPVTEPENTTEPVTEEETEKETDPVETVLFDKLFEVIPRQKGWRFKADGTLSFCLSVYGLDFETSMLYNADLNTAPNGYSGLFDFPLMGHYEFIVEDNVLYLNTIGVDEESKKIRVDLVNREVNPSETEAVDDGESHDDKPIQSDTGEKTDTTNEPVLSSEAMQTLLHRLSNILQGLPMIQRSEYEYILSLSELAAKAASAIRHSDNGESENGYGGILSLSDDKMQDVLHFLDTVAQDNHAYLLISLQPEDSAALLSVSLDCPVPKETLTKFLSLIPESNTSISEEINRLLGKSLKSIRFNLYLCVYGNDEPINAPSDADSYEWSSLDALFSSFSDSNMSDIPV